MAGRKPIPTAIKELNGNPGKRPMNDAEPQPKHGEPPMPTGLSKYAKAAWKRMVPVLLGMGVLTVADGDALLLYCEAYAQWKEAMLQIKKHGMTYTAIGIKEQVITRLSPYIGERDKAFKAMKSMLTEFGCTPSSRSRLKVDKPQETDPLDDFLSSNNSSASGTQLRQ